MCESLVDENEFKINGFQLLLLFLNIHKKSMVHVVRKELCTDASIMNALSLFNQIHLNSVYWVVRFEEPC